MVIGPCKNHSHDSDLSRIRFISSSAVLSSTTRSTKASVTVVSLSRSSKLCTTLDILFKQSKSIWYSVVYEATAGQLIGHPSLADLAQKMIYGLNFPITHPHTMTVFFSETCSTLSSCSTARTLSSEANKYETTTRNSKTQRYMTF